MKKKLLSILLIGVMVIGLTGCGNSSKEVNVASDLNEIHSNCMKENDGSVCNMNWRLQEYLESYSSYRLLNSSQSEFVVKPQEPKSLYSYGQSRDGVCAYKYALLYNKDDDSYYSVEIYCENNDANPKFINAKNLETGKEYKASNSDSLKNEKNDSANERNNEINNKSSSNSNENVDINTNNIDNESTDGLKVGNYIIKYGTYDGDAAAMGDTLIIKSDGTAILNGEEYTYRVGSHNFAQDSSSSSVEDCLILEGNYTNYYYVTNNGDTLSQGSGIDYNYSSN